MSGGARLLTVAELLSEPNKRVRGPDRVPIGVVNIPATRPLEWGVLVYSAAPPDIEAAGDASIEELHAAPPADGVGVAVQYGTDDGVRRWVNGAAQAAAPADMSDPKSLADFLQWGMRAVPARRYAVVLGGHGGGYLGAVSSMDRRRLMRPQEMAAALAASGCRPAVLAFNTCLMAQAEIAAELAPVADLLVASQAREEGVGMPLGAWLGDVAPDGTPREVARALVDASAETPARTPEMSAIDLKQAERLKSALDEVGRAILAAPDTRGAIREILEGLPSFHDRPWDRPLTDMKDLRAFSASLRALPSLRDAAERLRATLDDAVIARTGEGGGLSAWLPAASLSASHGDLGRAAEARWHDGALARGAWGEAVRFLTE